MGERRFGDAWEAEVAKRTAEAGRLRRLNAAGASAGWLDMDRPGPAPRSPACPPFTDPLQELADAEESLARGRWHRGGDGDEEWIVDAPDRWEPEEHPRMPTRADLLFHRLARMYAQWRRQAGPMSIAQAVSRVPEAEWTRLFEECMGIGPSSGPRDAASPPTPGLAPPAPACASAARERLPQRTLFGRPNLLERPGGQ